MPKLKYFLLSAFGLALCTTITWISMGILARLYSHYLSDSVSPVLAIGIGVVLYFAWIIFNMIRIEMNKWEDEE